MKLRAALMLLACAHIARPEPERSSTGRAWFLDGTGIEIYTVTTGATTAQSPKEILGIDRDGTFRAIVDNQHNILFVYRIKAKRVEGSDAISIRIEPDAGNGAFSGRTVQAAREFPVVKMGEVVTLDLLYNPATGEKVFDVLSPASEETPSPERSATSSAPVIDRLSFYDVRIRVNGQPMPTPGSWLVGAAAKLYVPGYGLYVLSVPNPKLPDGLFRSIGRADGGNLSWTANGIRIDITSKSNFLTKSNRGEVLVFHDPNFRLAEGPEVVSLQVAGDAVSLIPKKRTGIKIQ